MNKNMTNRFLYVEGKYSGMHDTLQQSGDEDTESETTIEDATLYQCSALLNCIFCDHKNEKSSTFANIKKKVSLCDIYQYYAHNEYLEKSKKDNAKKRKGQTICIHCSIHENQERLPYIASEVIGGVLDDKSATKLTVKELELGKNKVTFDKLSNSTKIRI